MGNDPADSDAGREEQNETSLESGRRYREIFNNMLDGFALHEIVLDDHGSPADYRFIDVNPAFERITGLERAMVVGRTVREVMPDIEDSWAERYGKVALSGKGSRFEGYAKSLGRHFEVVAFSTEKGLFAAIFSDVTEKKRVEEESVKLAEVVRHSQELINLSTPDGRMVYLNEVGCRMLGIDADAVSRHTIFDVMPSELMPMIKTQLIPSLTDFGKWEGELQYVNLKSGKRFDVHAMCFTIRDVKSGIVKYLVNVSTDITERKRAEAEIRASEMRFKGFYDSIADGMAHTDAAGKLLDCNDAFLNILGYEREELIGRKFTEITPEKWHKPELEFVQKTVYNKGKGEFEKEYVRKDGSVVPVSVSYWLVRDEGGNPSGVWALVRDMAERRSAEEEANKRMAEIEKLNRFMMGREMRILEMKREINELLVRLGEPARYKT